MQFFRTSITFKVFIGILLCLVIGVSSVQGVYAADPPKQKDATDAASTAIGTALYWVLSFMIKGVAALAFVLDYFIHYSVNESTPVIFELWKVIRDFCNMFFILIIIIMAFSTIFDIGGYRANGELITKFVMVAILINFSLTLSGLFIQGIDKVNGVFVNGIGSMSDRIGQSFNGSQLVNAGDDSIKNTIALMGESTCYISSLGTLSFICNEFGTRVASMIPSTYSWNTSFRMLFSVILVAVAGSGLLVAAFFSMIRIPFLWFLLIFSPIAALASILPATRAGWERWQKEFIGWNVFLPIYLFVMYFGFYILAKQNEIITNVNGWPAEAFSTPIPGLGYNLQFVFVYIVIGTVFWAGTGLALSLSRGFGGTASEYGSKWSQSAANWVTSPVRSRLEGAKEGLLARGERVRQEGIPTGPLGRIPYAGRVIPDRIGGSLNAAAGKASAAQFFGAKGAVEEQRRAKIKYFDERFKKDNLDTTDLRKKLSKTKGEEKLAIYKRLKDLKDLGGDEMLDAYKLYKSNIGPNSATDFAKDVDFKKDLEKNERLVWFRDNSVTNDIKKKLAGVMADEGEIKGTEDLLTAVRLFPPGNDQRDFLLSKAAKKNLVNAYTLAESLGMSDARGIPVNTSNYLEKEIAKRKPEDILGLIDGDWYNPKTDRIKLDGDLQPNQILLKNHLLAVMRNNAGLADRLLKEKATPEQELVIQALQKEAHPTPPDDSGGGSGGSPAGGGSPMGSRGGAPSGGSPGGSSRGGQTARVIPFPTGGSNSSATNPNNVVNLREETEEEKIKKLDAVLERRINYLQEKANKGDKEAARDLFDLIRRSAQ